MAKEPATRPGQPQPPWPALEGGGVHPDAARGRGRQASSRRAAPSVVAAVAVGGALGASARYGVSELLGVASDGGFPWATFWTNVSGSLALGFLLALMLERFPPSRYLRPFTATGFLGAYTTFSTFALETDLLIKDGHGVVAALYVGSSLLTGFGAMWAGIWAARACRCREEEV